MKKNKISYIINIFLIILMFSFAVYYIINSSQIYSDYIEPYTQYKEDYFEQLDCYNNNKLYYNENYDKDGMNVTTTLLENTFRIYKSYRNKIIPSILIISFSSISLIIYLYFITYLTYKEFFANTEKNKQRIEKMRLAKQARLEKKLEQLRNTDTSSKNSGGGGTTQY